MFLNLKHQSWFVSTISGDLRFAVSDKRSQSCELGTSTKSKTGYGYSSDEFLTAFPTESVQYTCQRSQANLAESCPSTSSFPKSTKSAYRSAALCQVEVAQSGLLCPAACDDSLIPLFLASAVRLASAHEVRLLTILLAETDCALCLKLAAEEVVENPYVGHSGFAHF